MCKLNSFCSKLKNVFKAYSKQQDLRDTYYVANYFIFYYFITFICKMISNSNQWIMVWFQ